MDHHVEALLLAIARSVSCLSISSVAPQYKCWHIPVAWTSTTQRLESPTAEAIYHQHIEPSFNEAEAVRMIIEDGPWTRANPNRVKLLRPACVAYGHPDLSTTHDYLVDFGLTEVTRHLKPQETIYYRGYSVQPVLYVAVKTEKPEFLGLYFEADSMDELEKASKIPGAGEIRDLKYPGGGKVLDIIDPSGILLHVIYGMEKREFTPRFNEVQPPNYPSTEDSDVTAKPRRGVFHSTSSTRACLDSCPILPNVLKYLHIRTHDRYHSCSQIGPHRLRYE
jgi:hypothetical protein